jgi:hypothetical protein
MIDNIAHLEFRISNVGTVAGAKRMAILRAVVVAAGLRGTQVLQAEFGDDLAGTRLADGTLRISPRLCDALIEVMANLPTAAAPGKLQIANCKLQIPRNGHAA